jgi:hypothetical protein
LLNPNVGIAPTRTFLKQHRRRTTSAVCIPLVDSSASDGFSMNCVEKLPPGEFSACLWGILAMSEIRRSRPIYGIGFSVTAALEFFQHSDALP